MVWYVPYLFTAWGFIYDWCVWFFLIFLALVIDTEVRRVEK